MIGTLSAASKRTKFPGDHLTRRTTNECESLKFAVSLVKFGFGNVSVP